jgi:Trk-type K+ transport system membrane component
MWIGASPASTGGGIKTTTFAISILNALSLAKGKDRLEVFMRELSFFTVQRAYAAIFLSLIVIGVSVFLITIFQSELGLMSILFETVSAFGTVGLSLGITAKLNVASKLTIIVTMFIGRVSMLTILIAFFKKVKHLHYRYPSENVLIN